MLKRRDINHLTADQRDRYVAAVDRTQRNGRYAKQVDIHREHGKHVSDLFFPWHRCFLFHFERLLQAEDPTVTIPYWDWSRPEPDGSRYPAPFGVAGSVLCHERPGTEPLPANTLHVVMSNTSWKLFGGGVWATQDQRMGHFERGPHAYVHAHYVQGSMGELAVSVRDPLFWSAHAFIDLLWDVWSKRYSREMPTSQGVQFTFPQSPNSVGDVLTVESLGYEYELTEELEGDLAREQGTPLGALESSQPLRLLGHGTLADALRGSRAAYPLPASHAPNRFVKLVGLRIPTAANYSLAASLRSEDGRLVLADFATLLRMKHQPHGPTMGMPMKSSITFDLRDALKKLPRARDTRFELEVVMPRGSRDEDRRDVLDEIVADDVVVEQYG